jgi:hypothetical protein
MLKESSFSYQTELVLTLCSGLKILERLHARPDDPHHITAREEFMQIHKQVELECSQKVGNLIQLLMHPTYRRRMWYGFFFQCLAQMTGVLVINNYQVLLQSIPL